ncbi:ankyrin repeat domain-containing protein [bacterium]|nr:ankyrin repeat domain-containing protein [bacterium]
MSLFENDSRFNITEELKRKDNTENTLTHYAARNGTLTGLNAIRSYINDDYKALNTRKETPFLIALKIKNIHFAEAIFNIDPFCLNVRTICALKKFTSNDLEILRNLMRETPSLDQELNTLVSQLTKETIRTTLFNDEQVYILKNILKDNHRLYSMLIMDEDNHLIDSIMLLVQYAPTHIEFAMKILTRYPRAALYQHKNGTNLLDMILQYPLGVYSNARLKALYLEFISQAIDLNPSLLFQRDAKGLTTIMRFMNMNYKDRDIEPQVVDLLLKDPKGYLLSDNTEEQSLLSDMKGNTIAHLAVKNFALQSKILKQVLTTIPHANARNHDGLTPLMYAIRCRHSGAISVMMDFPLKVDINLTGENEEPLLNIAITKNLSIDGCITKMLQHPGLNLQQRDKDGIGMIEFILKRRKFQLFDKLSRIHSLDLNELNSQGQPLLFELINFWSSTLETLDKYKRNKLKRAFLETLDLFCQSSTQHSPFTCFNMDAHLLNIIKLLDNVPERKDIISHLLINPGFDPKKTNHDGYTFFNWAKKEGDEILLSCLKESNHMLEGDEQQDGAILLSRQSNDHAITSTPMICFSTPSLTNSKKRKRSLSERLHP